VYEEEKTFKFQKSWYNEIVVICEKYGIGFDERKISEMGKTVWRNLVKKKVHENVILQINEECKLKSKTKSFPPVKKIQPQRYFKTLPPHDARIFFRVRSRMIDLRAVTHYMHERTICRLCNSADETIGHVLNACELMERSNHVIKTEDIYDDGDDATTRDVVQRMKQILRAVEEKDDISPSTTGDGRT
jgi:hypothetical protein